MVELLEESLQMIRARNRKPYPNLIISCNTPVKSCRNIVRIPYKQIHSVWTTVVGLKANNFQGKIRIG